MTHRLLYYDGRRPQAHIANLVANVQTGYVGIGTQTPIAKLHVGGNIYVTSNITFTNPLAILRPTGNVLIHTSTGEVITSNAMNFDQGNVNATNVTVSTLGFDGGGGSGPVSSLNLQDITEQGASTDRTVTFSNVTTAFITAANVVIGTTCTINETGTAVAISRGSSGVSVDGNANELFIEDNDNCGLTIACPESSVGSIHFSNPGAPLAGRIRYNHASNAMIFDTNNENNGWLFLDNQGRLGVNQSTPTHALHVGNDVLVANTTTGRVGVGLAVPSATLSVYHPTDNTVLWLESGDPSVNITFKDNNTTNRPYLQCTTNDLIMGHVSGGNRVVLTDTSNLSVDSSTFFVDGLNDKVGVGTTTPASPLTVEYSGAGTSAIRVDSDDNAILSTRYQNGIGPDAGCEVIIQTSNTAIGVGDIGQLKSGDAVGDIQWKGASDSHTFQSMGRIKVVSKTAVTTADAASEMRFYTTNNSEGTVTQRMVINENGYVGIGTSTPNKFLDVVNTQPNLIPGPIANSFPIASFRVLQTGSASIRGLEIGGPPGGVADAPIYLKRSGTGNRFGILNDSDVEQFTILDGGNVGIGTNGPLDLLQLRSTSATAYDATVDDGQYGNGAGITITNMDLTNESFAQVNMQVSGASGRALGRIVTIRKGSATSDMAFITESSGVISEKMRIASGGSVSIGTASSYGKLSVLGNNSNVLNSFNIGTATSNGVVSTIYNTNETVGSYAGIRLITRNSGASQWGIFNKSTGSDTSNLVFTHGTGGIGSELMNITYDGKVGIGPNTPANYQLHIVRKAGTSGNILLDGDTGASGNPKIIFRDINTSRSGILDFNDTTNTFTFNSSVGLRVQSINGTTTGANASIKLFTDKVTDNSFQEIFRVANTGSSSNDGYLQLFDSGATKVSIVANSSRGGDTYFNGGGKLAIGTDVVGYGLFTNQRVTINPTNDGMVVAPLAANYSAYTVQADNNSGTRYALYIANGSGSMVGTISFTSGGVSYNSISDYRAKQDFKQFNGLNLVSAMKTYDFEWKIDGSRSYGIIAHELKEVVPYVVLGDKDGEDFQSVDYSKLVPILIKSIQELKAEIDALKTR